MELTKKEVLELLYHHPIEIGHWVGFKDLTDMHNDWLRSFLYSDQDQTLQGHRGSFKTTVLSIFLAIHAVIAPNETVLFFRKTGGDVTEVIRQTGNILKSGCMNTIVHTLYGKDLILTKDSSCSIQTNLSTSIKGSNQIEGLGIYTSITGKHSDIVVTDDIINVNDRVSQAERDTTKRAYMELQNIKNRNGRFINTGTPWHKEDAFTLMPNPVKYDCYSTGLISPEMLEQIKSKMTSSLFAANYELRHIAAEDVIFDNPQTGADPSLAEQGLSHIDAAYHGEDFTAFTIVNRKDDKYYVYGRIWRKHIDDVEDEIIRLRRMFNAGRIHCEDNGDKGYLAKSLQRKGERTRVYHEGQNKYLKITSYLKDVWKDVIFVAGTDKKYIEQICDYNEDAEHDDAPDSLASLIRILWKKPESNYTPIWNGGFKQ